MIHSRRPGFRSFPRTRESRGDIECLSFCAGSPLSRGRAGYSGFNPTGSRARALFIQIESLCSPNILLAHDLFRKPVPTFRDHALVATACPARDDAAVVALDPGRHHAAVLPLARPNGDATRADADGGIRIVLPAT